MANFKTHLNVVAVVSSVPAVIISVNDLQFIPLLALSGIVGGLLPDIDLGSSKPSKILFSLLSFAVGLALFMMFVQKDIKEALLYAFLGLLGVYFVLKPIFSKITRHRGIFHSIPMAVLFGIGTYYLFNINLEYKKSLYLGLFLMGGYLIHLLLDEVYSLDFRGRRIKRSFGSALQLFDFKQKFLYMVMYVAIAILVVNIVKTNNLYKEEMWQKWQKILDVKMQSVLQKMNVSVMQ